MIKQKLILKKAKNEEELDRIKIRYGQLISLKVEADELKGTVDLLKLTIVENPYVKHTAVITGFFAVELYLKLICAIENSSKKAECFFMRGHRLHALFEEISHDNKEAIIKRFSQISSVNLNCFLKEYNNGFEKWRYLFQAKQNLNVDLEELSKILDVLAELADDIMPRDFEEKDAKSIVGTTITLSK